MGEKFEFVVPREGVFLSSVQHMLCLTPSSPPFLSFFIVCRIALSLACLFLPCLQVVDFDGYSGGLVSRMPGVEEESSSQLDCFAEDDEAQFMKQVSGAQSLVCSPTSSWSSFRLCFWQQLLRHTTICCYCRVCCSKLLYFMIFFLSYKIAVASEQFA